MAFFKKNNNNGIINSTKQTESTTNEDTSKKTMINLHKTRGRFINAYETDAFILSDFFGYRVLDGKKCGFPETSLEKVKSTLEENSINYQIIYPDKDPYIKKFENNRYDEFKEKAVSTMTYKIKVEKICEYLKSASDKEIDEVLGVLEKVCIK